MLGYQRAADDGSLHLDICQVPPDIAYGGDGCAVDVAERIDVKQVAEGLHTQFSLEESGPLGPHPAKVLYFRIKRRHIYKYTEKTGRADEY